jgi:hypothetical protein
MRGSDKLGALAFFVGAFAVVMMAVMVARNHIGTQNDSRCVSEYELPAPYALAAYIIIDQAEQQGTTPAEKDIPEYAGWMVEDGEMIHQTKTRANVMIRSTLDCVGFDEEGNGIIEYTVLEVLNVRD